MLDWCSLRSSASIDVVTYTNVHWHPDHNELTLFWRRIYICIRIFICPYSNNSIIGHCTVVILCNFSVRTLGQFSKNIDLENIKKPPQKVAYLWQLGVPDCPKQPRTSFPFHKLFHTTISCRISDGSLDQIRTSNFWIGGSNFKSANSSNILWTSFLIFIDTRLICTLRSDLKGTQ